MKSAKHSIIYDRSVYTYDRSALGLPDESYMEQNDRSMLRGLNLNND